MPESPHTFLRRALAALVVILAAGALLPGVIARAGPAERLAQMDQDTVTFVLGNVQFVLLHELAHLVIDDKNVPIIGPEEHAADYIATTVLILGDRLNDDQKRRAIEFLLAAAEAFSLSWQRGSEIGTEVRYWGVHALNVQRYHQVICLLYGSNPEIFNDLPGRVGMPNARKLGCSAEFARAARSTRWLLEHFGSNGEKQDGAAVHVEYTDADTLVTRRLLDEVRRAGIVENTMARFSERFVLERPMEVVLRRCGRPESAWIPEQRKLVICHELLEGLYHLSLRRQPGESQQPLADLDAVR